MTTLNVLFDGEKVNVVTYFASPQDQEIYPDYGTLDASDARWKAYYERQPSFVQAYLPAPD